MGRTKEISVVCKEIHCYRRGLYDGMRLYAKAVGEPVDSRLNPLLRELWQEIHEGDFDDTVVPERIQKKRKNGVGSERR